MDNYALFARYFDLFSAQAADDLPMYAGLAQQNGGPALELGCGSGRVMLALAREGLDVTGIDNSPAMLAIARRRFEQEGLSARAALVQANLGDFDLERRFRLAICAQNTFCHMLSSADQLGLLRAARRHLEPEGLLVLDVFNPDPAAMVNNDRRLVLMGVATDPATGRTFTQTLSRDIDAGEQIEHVAMFVDELDNTRLLERHVFEFDLRYVYRFELELLLDKAGLALEALYGSYDLEPYAGESERLLAVARHAPSSRAPVARKTSSSSRGAAPPSAAPSR